MARLMEDNFFYHSFQILVNRLQNNDKNLFPSFAALTSDQERFSFLNETEEVHQIFDLSNFKTVIKSSVLAQQKRNDGNNFFKSGQYGNALSLYNESVAMSPVDEMGQDGKNDLALAYSNRSAALFYLKRFDECLADVENALLAGYPKELQFKLKDRKGKCLLSMGYNDLAKIAFEEAKSLISFAKVDEKNKESLISSLTKSIKQCGVGRSEIRAEKGEVENMVPDVAEGTHDTFISLSSTCDVTYQDSKGRFIVARRDIKPGEVILVEKPYASVLLPHQYENHCHHCFHPFLASVPCKQCPTAVYCSLECRDKSWESYHHHECISLEFIHKSGVGKFGHLALRTVSSSGLERLLDFKSKLNSGDCQTSKHHEGCNSHGLYVSKDYNPIYHLVTHHRDRSSKDLFSRTVMSFFLVKCLLQSSFFSSVPSVKRKETIEYVGGLILSHLQSFPCNAHEIAELELNDASVGTSVPKEIGAGIYATLSLFNHSCDPTVNRNFYRDTCVVRAIKTIYKGQEVSDNYGAVYAVQSHAERYQKLTPQYYFQCGCEPCSQNWPLYSSIENENPRFKCPNCREVLTGNQCQKCSCPAELSILRKELAASEDIFQEGFQKLLENDVPAALPKLLHHLEQLDRLVVLPWRDYNNCQEAVKQCFSIMGNCVNI